MFNVGQAVGHIQPNLDLGPSDREPVQPWQQPTSDKALRYCNCDERSLALTQAPQAEVKLIEAKPELRQR